MQVQGLQALHDTWTFPASEAEKAAHRCVEVLAQVINGQEEHPWLVGPALSVCHHLLQRCPLMRGFHHDPGFLRQCIEQLRKRAIEVAKLKDGMMREHVTPPTLGLGKQELFVRAVCEAVVGVVAVGAEYLTHRIAHPVNGQRVRRQLPVLRGAPHVVRFSHWYVHELQRGRPPPAGAESSFARWINVVVLDQLIHECVCVVVEQGPVQAPTEHTACLVVAHRQKGAVGGRSRQLRLHGHVWPLEEPQRVRDNSLQATSFEKFHMLGWVNHPLQQAYAGSTRQKCQRQELYKRQGVHHEGRSSLG
mmetsp:Transcript_71131/g.164477  ORF Transcript_71131/g.164477 Transcript_71131/m.164477 type:complete len:305 (+) Transcript_71131:386-1300(+)